jgi:hypothetical protein
MSDAVTKIARALASRNRQTPMAPVVQALVGEPDPRAMAREQFNRMDGNEAFDTFEGMQNSGGTMPPRFPWREGRMDGSSFNDAAAYDVAQADTGTMTDAPPQSYADKVREAGLDLNVTEAQRSGQALRLLQAEAILRQLEEKQGIRTGQRALEYLPDFIENLVIDDDYGRYIQARDAFAEAAMRADTGATINESEWPRVQKSLFVRPGDDADRIAQRRAMRETYIQGLVGSSGEAGALMPEVGQPVVPVPNLNPQELSDEDLLRMLQGGQ